MNWRSSQDKAPVMLNFGIIAIGGQICFASTLYAKKELLARTEYWLVGNQSLSGDTDKEKSPVHTGNQTTIINDRIHSVVRTHWIEAYSLIKGCSAFPVERTGSTKFCLHAVKMKFYSPKKERAYV